VAVEEEPLEEKQVFLGKEWKHNLGDAGDTALQQEKRLLTHILTSPVAMPKRTLRAAVAYIKTRYGLRGKKRW
jgi:hypothetical protein